MPKPTNTQDLTARYLAAGAGFKPEEQFFALLNAASHLGQKQEDNTQGVAHMKHKITRLQHCFAHSEVLEPLADDKAPF